MATRTVIHLQTHLCKRFFFTNPTLGNQGNDLGMHEGERKREQMPQRLLEWQALHKCHVSLQQVEKTC